MLSALFLAGCRQNLVGRWDRAAVPSPWTAGNDCRLCRDSDGDGLPDAAEMKSFEDRQSFRRWFTAIAEMQFYKLAAAWNVEQRDCAGLVRFAWRETLRRHDRLWFQGMGEGYEPVAPDIQAYTLDRSPLGEKLYRCDFGSFEKNDLEAGRFNEFADARTLKNYNAVFVSRDRNRAEVGDLLFFHRPHVPKFPYHVMIFLGEARLGNYGARDWVLYHTGPSPAGPSPAAGGEVKKLRLSVLDRHPDRQWRPLDSNRHFLGFYRLKILE